MELEKKIQKYKKRVESYKQDHENLMTQLNMLKDEIKNNKFKADEVKTLVKNFVQVSKPKDKKPYEEALNRICLKLGINDQIDTDRASKEAKENKKGLMGLFK